MVEFAFCKDQGKRWLPKKTNKAFKQTGHGDWKERNIRYGYMSRSPLQVQNEWELYVRSQKQSIVFRNMSYTVASQLLYTQKHTKILVRKEEEARKSMQANPFLGIDIDQYPQDLFSINGTGKPSTCSFHFSNVLACFIYILHILFFLFNKFYIYIKKLIYMKRHGEKESRERFQAVVHVLPYVLNHHAYMAGSIFFSQIYCKK